MLMCTATHSIILSVVVAALQSPSLARLMTRSSDFMNGPQPKDPWDNHITGLPLTYMAVSSVVYFCITLLLERERVKV